MTVRLAGEADPKSCGWPDFIGSFPNSGERGPDLEEEAVVAGVAIGNALDDFDGERIFPGQSHQRQPQGQGDAALSQRHLAKPLRVLINGHRWNSVSAMNIKNRNRELLLMVETAHTDQPD